MQQEFSFQVSPETAGNAEAVKHFVSRQYGLPLNEITHVEILKEKY